MSLRPIGRILRPLVALLLTTYVLWRASPAAVVRAAAEADLAWIGLAVALVVVDRALMAYRWIVLLCPIDAAERPPLLAVLRIFFVSTFAGTFLPASIGGDIVRAYGLSQLQVAPGQAMASVLMDRLLGVVSILIVGAVGLLLASTGDLASTRAITLSLAAGAGASLAAASVIFSERAAALAQAIALRMPVAAIRAIGAELTRATRAYGTHHGELANVLAGSIAVQVLRILQAYCLGRALGIDAPLAVYFGLIPLILLVMLLPVSINGIGTSQMAFVWFFGRVGVPQAEAFALSVLFVALGVVGNLPGGLLYAFGPRPVGRPRQP
ncbi:MAG TPA: lysylphosphatidylglycerol synthase transmembrane domain-containing protein [Vicinamibacterales bacterium]|nr:lysylphosphatidylglycerol synthase transmembrane domain-containing protein [Vicinamibacterales bacterium]